MSDAEDAQPPSAAPSATIPNLCICLIPLGPASSKRNERWRARARLAGLPRVRSAFGLKLQPQLGRHNPATTRPSRWGERKRIGKTYFEVGWSDGCFTTSFKKLSAISIFINSPSIQSRSSALGLSFSCCSSCSFRARRLSMVVMVKDLARLAAVTSRVAFVLGVGPPQEGSKRPLIAQHAGQKFGTRQSARLAPR
jgi:hypothetical protein